MHELCINSSLVAWGTVVRSFGDSGRDSSNFLSTAPCGRMSTLLRHCVKNSVTLSPNYSKNSIILTEHGPNITHPNSGADFPNTSPTIP